MYILPLLKKTLLLLAIFPNVCLIRWW